MNNSIISYYIDRNGTPHKFINNTFAPEYVFRIDYVVHVHGQQYEAYAILKGIGYNEYLTDIQLSEWQEKTKNDNKIKYDAHNIFIQIINITKMLRGTHD